MNVWTVIVKQRGRTTSDLSVDLKPVCKRWVFRRLIAEIPGIEEVSRELAMNVRFLQDGLKKGGISFLQILHNVRKEMAIIELLN